MNRPPENDGPSQKSMTVSPLRRRTMQAVRGANTTPEIKVRKLLFQLGYRYRLHRGDLPGHPDIVFPGRRALIFIHGCFWHGHHCRRGDRKPASNRDYWLPKLERTKLRDVEQQKALRALGWSVLVLWECELRDAEALTARLKAFLGPAAN